MFDGMAYDGEPAEPENDEHPRGTHNSQAREKTAGELLAELGTDARKWAVAFHKQFDRTPDLAVDIDWLTGWFANAITAGEVAERRRATEENAVGNGPGV